MAWRVPRWAVVGAAAVGLCVGWVRAAKHHRERDQLDEEVRPSPRKQPPLLLQVADVPGRPKSLGSEALDWGASAIQRFRPLHHIGQHVCGVHFYSGDMQRQVIAHHFCSHMNEDFRQCIIFDSDAADARMIGVEYIISRRLFEALPPEEQALWHSHAYEVSSGTLLTPGVPEIVERRAMAQLEDTYGKTWHFWQVDRNDPLPLGAPRLMMAFTQDGQLHPELRRKVEQQYGVSTAEKRESRRQQGGLGRVQPHEAADAWKHGVALQTQLVRVSQPPA